MHVGYFEGRPGDGWKLQRCCLFSRQVVEHPRWILRLVLRETIEQKRAAGTFFLTLTIPCRGGKNSTSESCPDARGAMILQVPMY